MVDSQGPNFSPQAATVEDGAKKEYVPKLMNRSTEAAGGRGYLIAIPFLNRAGGDLDAAVDKVVRDQVVSALDQS